MSRSGRTSQRAARRLRNQQRKRARELLDRAFQEYLSSLNPPSVPKPREASEELDVEYLQNAHTPSRSQSPLSPERVPASPSPSLPSWLEPSYSPVSSPEDNRPPSPTESTCSVEFLPEPSYSPVSSPEDNRPPSPAESTSSVEFLDEIPFVPPPPPRHYFFGVHEDYCSLIAQFPLLTSPLPPNTYSLGPESFNLEELRTTLSGLSPNSTIPVFLPEASHPHLVPVQVFYNMFPPSTARIEEIPPSPTPSE